MRDGGTRAVRLVVHLLFRWRASKAQPGEMRGEPGQALPWHIFSGEEEHVRSNRALTQAYRIAQIINHSSNREMPMRFPVARRLFVCFLFSFKSNWFSIVFRTHPCVRTFFCVFISIIHGSGGLRFPALEDPAWHGLF